MVESHLGIWLVDAAANSLGDAQADTDRAADDESSDEHFEPEPGACIKATHWVPALAAALLALLRLPELLLARPDRAVLGRGRGRSLLVVQLAVRQARLHIGLVDAGRCFGHWWLGKRKGAWSLAVVVEWGEWVRWITESVLGRDRGERVLRVDVWDGLESWGVVDSWRRNCALNLDGQALLLLLFNNRHRRL